MDWQVLLKPSEFNLAIDNVVRTRISYDLLCQSESPKECPVVREESRFYLLVDSVSQNLGTIP